jgi:3-dehydroquinate synthase
MRATIRKPYPVFIGQDLLRSFDFSKFPASKYVIITDATVERLFFRELSANSSLPNHHVYKIIIPKGERSKSFTEAATVLRKLAQAEIDRDALLIALGGGVIGDLTGFVASIYKRGINFMQIPTTLLSQVDSSLGGKTAINLPEGKNLVGSTLNPVAVLSDTSVLQSLPKSDISAGYAELIKYGMIYDKKLFGFLEEHVGTSSPQTLQQLVAMAANIKLAISERDPLEREYRKILNYGHTIGHAMELASDHRLSHGQAVALGMLGEAYIAKALGILPAPDMERQNALIRATGPRLGMRFDEEELLDLMHRDKKAKKGKLYFVLPRGIGRVYQVKQQVAFPVAEHIVRKGLRYLTNLEA